MRVERPAQVRILLTAIPMTEETPLRDKQSYGFPVAEKGIKYRRNVKDGYVTVQVKGYGDDSVITEVVDEQNSIVSEGVEVEIEENHFDQYYEKITNGNQ